MNELKPNVEETNAGLWLQSLFNFKTELSYYIYDYGKRVCNITLRATGGYTALAYRGHDPYGRDKNSIKLMEFAWNKLPKGEEQWYDVGTGFTMPFYRVIELQKRLKNEN